MTAVILAHGIAALVCPFFFRRWGRTCFYVLSLVPAVCFVWLCTLAPAVLGRGEQLSTSLPWIPSLGISLTFRMDALSWILSAMVLGVGALVLFYCAQYFRHTNQHSGRFAAELVAFAGVMFGLVTADDLMVMFVFWEVTSVLSYLLIGYANARQSARRAALQALIVTTAGGLAMFIGLVMLGNLAGTYLISQIVDTAPTWLVGADPGYLAAVVVLVLVGAGSKSALFPLHFWLPGAMAAPTPVSAFLHAAAMVKAGIYLIARLAPVLAPVQPWLPMVLGLGLFTMLFGGYAALKQHDLKLILAYGTISQLGFLAAVVGLGTPDALYAGLAMMVAHSLFKSTLFLLTGVIDHQAGTRDIRRLSGIRHRAPWLFAMAVVASASMAGIPSLLGFVAKEAVVEVGLDASHGEVAGLGAGAGWLVLLGIAVGSVLTLAYTARFLWGAFADKRPSDVLAEVRDEDGAVRPTGFHRITPAFAVAPAVLAVLCLGLGLWPEPVSAAVHAYTEQYGHGHLHLALWHGLTPALGVSGIIIACGLLLFAARRPVQSFQLALPQWPAADAVYRAVVGAIDWAAVRVTGATQRGSLSFYLAVIMVTAVLVPTVGLFLVDTPPLNPLRWTDSPAQWATVIIMIAAALIAQRARKRFLAILMVSVTGYGISLLFALRGAPDLALTQMLVETISLIAFVLALRMLPSGLWNRLGARVRHRAARVAISIGFGAFMMVLAAFALSSRITDPISLAMPQAAYEIGHGKNVVNVILVDMRAWDTFGETSVLALAATGVASLIFIAGRQDLSRARKRLDTQGLRTVTRRYAGRTDLSPGAQVANDFMDVQRDPFLVAGRTLAPENRSLMLEVVTRLIFHSILIVSLYLLLAGHNLPGGGFAGGLLAGLALALRYLAGGRYELSEASPVNAGVLLGSGLLISGAYALSPLLWGGDVFTSYAFDLHLPVFGEVHLVTALIFDIGVYLVVVGLILDVLRSLGGKIDENLEQEREASARRARGPRRIQVRRSSTVAATPSGPVTATPVDEDGEATADTAAVAGEGGRA